MVMVFYRVRLLLTVGKGTIKRTNRQIFLEFFAGWHDLKNVINLVGWKKNSNFASKLIITNN